MITRIRAVRSTFGLALTTFELVIAFHFLASLLDFRNSGIAEAFGGIFSGNKYQPASPFRINGIEGPASFLFIVLAFMIFSFIIITLVPKMVEKQERKMRPDYE